MSRSRAEPIDVIGGEGEITSLSPVRLGVVGCGSHTYRNVLPPLRQIPWAVLAAFCDRNVEKARLYARNFSPGAPYFGSVEAMLTRTELDGVIVVVGFDDQTGSPLYPQVVMPILRHGLPVWMEKPPAADRHGVALMMEAAQAGGTFAQIGFKKVFSPAVERLKQITGLPQFGPITQYRYSYDVDLPARPGDLLTPSARRFLDDFVHVASVIDYLTGIPSRVQVVRAPSGAGVITTQHANGVIGAIALSNAGSGLAPVERLEIIGTGANVVLENGAYLKYYPKGDRGPYGTSTNYLPPVTVNASADFGPSMWEPEFSLGNLHGGSHFLQGYFHQMHHFVDAVRAGRLPERCGLDMAHRVMSFIDTITYPFDTWRQVDGQSPVAFAHEPDAQLRFTCPRTGVALVMKDGWNYVCRECGRTRPGRPGFDFHCERDRPASNNIASNTPGEH